MSTWPITLRRLPCDYTKLTPGEKAEVREQYAELQKGVCWYCKYPLAFDPPERIMKKSINWKQFPPDFRKHPIHLQHDHDTGMTEGTVHAYCNAVLWQYHGR